ncbi:hypothetical protein GGQ68_000712 [Sagittula marina]|uniref:Uncharacterized protein n=1 Tax=Sagittula marina TaxID=943940 RepID=A0A7W6DJH7_9RHOB|nr:hypothetical protein [Sagittula marina]MBB3984396.1 hypothetical protein [Sagittula marina]
MRNSVTEGGVTGDEVDLTHASHTGIAVEVARYFAGSGCNEHASVDACGRSAYSPRLSSFCI